MPSTPSVSSFPHSSRLPKKLRGDLDAVQTWAQCRRTRVFPSVQALIAVRARDRATQSAVRTTEKIQLRSGIVSSGHWFAFMFDSPNLPACVAAVLDLLRNLPSHQQCSWRRSGPSSHRISGNRIRNVARHRSKWTEPPVPVVVPYVAHCRPLLPVVDTEPHPTTAAFSSLQSHSNTHQSTW